MSQEIERKFLVNDWTPVDPWPETMVQGYLSCGLRVRHCVTTVQGARLTDCTITLKEPTDDPRVRKEIEAPIPEELALALLKKCTKQVRKIRYTESHKGTLWEIDVFTDRVLILAEVELDTPDQEFVKPDWLGEEVTGKPEFYNEALAR